MENEEKTALLREIERLLSFDGKEVVVNPDYLAYLDLETLKGILDELRRRQEKMVERHKTWAQGFIKER